MTKKEAVKPAIVAYLAFVLFGALISIINSNFMILSTHFSVSLTQVSYMISAMAAGRLSTIFISGVISDKIGRKQIIALSIICVCLFYFFLPMTKNFTIAMILVIIAGMGHGMVDAAATALLFDCFYEKPDFAIGLIQAFFCLGAFSTPIITSFLFNKEFYFGWLFWGLSILGVCAIFWLLAVKFPAYQVHEEKSDIETVKFFKKPEVMNEGLSIAVVTFLYSLATTTMTTWIGTYAIAVVELSEIKSIEILSYYNIGCITGTVVMAKLTEKIHPAKMLLINAAAMPIILLIYTTANIAAITFVIFIAVGFFAGINYSLLISIAGELFPDKKATVSGAVMGMSALGAIVTPIVTGYLYDSMGIEFAFKFLFIAFALLIISIFFFKRKYRNLQKENMV